MHGYVCTERLLINKGNRQFKVIHPVSSLDTAEVNGIQLEAAEYDIVRDQLKEKYGEEALSSKIRIAPDQQIAAWQHFPPRLGRFSLSLIEKEKVFDHQNEKSPLHHQLRLLKSRAPWKKHFRIAIVNGFGGNLGDNLIGITAFREVAKVLGDELGSFSVDILFGWLTNPACKDLFAHEKYISNVYFSGLPLTKFGHYDAHFDIAHLILYPNYDKMPVVDWYLWWLGLEPEEISPKSKRNQLTLPYTTWNEVSSLLKARSEKKILFVYRASVPLRSIPEAQARRILLDLINADKDYIYVTDIGIGIQHPRLMDLSGKVNSPDKFKALIAQVDALITIDSFAQHVADATATPSLLLSAVLPEEFYPYYPFQAFMLLPGAENLPAWKRVKTTDEEWAKIQDAYSGAWEKVKAVDLKESIATQIQKRAELLKTENVNFNFADIAPRATFTRLETGSFEKKTIKWKYENISEAWQRSSEQLINLGRVLLRPGCIVTHVCPGSGKVPVELAESIFPTGEYHIWEPRRLYAQTQAADFMLAGFELLHLRNALPINIQERKIPLEEIDPFSETNPAQAGNAQHYNMVTIERVEDYLPPMCRLLIIQPPAPIEETLEAHHILIEQHQPFLFLAPFVVDDRLRVATSPLAKKFKYRFYSDSVGLNHRQIMSCVIIGVPDGQDVNVAGFTELVLSTEEANLPEVVNEF